MVADDDLSDFWIRARAMAHARGSLFAAMSTSVWEGCWHWRCGDLTEALSHAGVALDQDRMWGGSGVGRTYTRWFQIGALLDQGDLVAAREVADAASAEPAAGEGLRLLRQAFARLLVAEGRYAEALPVLDETVAATRIANPAWDPWRSIKAEALHGLGRMTAAMSLMEEEVVLLRRWGAPSYLGRGLRLLGELQDSGGEQLLREAVSLLEGSAAAIELARARCALGRSPAVPDAEAVALLRAAAEAADARGAVAVCEQARTALLQRGHRADPRPDAARSLSSTERSILGLAAEGLSVNEVAQRLLLTPGIVRAALAAEDAQVPR
jgi:DNA-binding NarL/FixJ family response regulator